MVNKYVLTGLVVLIAIGFAYFKPNTQPTLSPLVLQWKSLGANATKFKHNNYDIFYVDQTNKNANNNGQTLLYLHGFPTSSLDLHLMFPSLIRNFKRVLAPDLIGFGFSAKPKNYSYSLMDQTNLVVELIELNRIKKVHLLTHDYADSVGQELLVRYREKKLNFEIVSICMTNGGVFPSLHRPVLTQKLFRMPIVSTLMAKLSNYYLFSSSLRKTFGPSTQPSDDTLTDSWSLIVLNQGNELLGPLLSYIDERFVNEKRWVGAIENSPVPLHFIYGPKDPINQFPVFVDTYKQKVSRASIVVLPEIGHWPGLEAPGKVLIEYFNFLLANKFIDKTY